VLNFVLHFCPTHPSEKDLMARFGNLGIGGDGDFDSNKLSPEIRKAVEDGIADAWQVYASLKRLVSEHKVTSGDVFGTREHLKNNYTYRMSAAVDGIYGNSSEEAVYPVYFVDSASRRMDGTNGKYTLRFAPDQMPPVNAFWSLTLYELPASLLSANPLNRYLINSPLLPNLKRDQDGGLTLYIQNESPARDREPNWLPAPRGPFFCALRLYWPKPEALDGRWKVPQLKRVNGSEG